MSSTQLRKFSLYPEFRSNEGIDDIINYLTSINKGFVPIYFKTLNTRQKIGMTKSLQKISRQVRVNYFTYQESETIKRTQSR